MITYSFWALFGLAFIMSTEFGQTATEVIRRGIKDGFKESMLVSFGAFFAEVGFLILTLTGLIFLFVDHPWILKYIWLVGGSALLYLGISGLRNFRNTVNVDKETEKTKYQGALVTGFVINFVHPLNILWWSGTLGPIVLESIHKNGYVIATMDGMGVPLGGITWWIILSTIVFFLKKFPESWTQKINFASSLGVLCFGMYFLYKGVFLFF